MNGQDRLASIDALRGADMFCIMGGASAAAALCAMLGAGDCWLAGQMEHALWNGFRHHDTIFPLFLFLAGVSWPFSLAKQRERGRGSAAIAGKIVLRAAALILLGMASSRLFAFDFAHVRYASVLSHIAAGWAVAAFLDLFARPFAVRFAAFAAILAGYWALLAFTSAPDAAALLADPSVAAKAARYAAEGTGGFSFAGNIAGWIDRTVMPGTLYEGIFDPEGIVSKAGAAATAMLGVFAGNILRKDGVGGMRKTFLLALCGAACLAVCLVWKTWCPVNKKLWTPTFVMAAGAYSFFALALFYWTVDVMGWRRWTFFFRVIGMNALAIYLLMQFVPFREMARFFFSGIAGLGGPEYRRFVLACGQIALEWLVLLHLYRKGVFLKV